MVFARIRYGDDKRRMDPIERLSDDVRADARRGTIPVDRVRGKAEFAAEHLAQPAAEPAWQPPEGVRTFSDYGMAEAAQACQRRPHVVLRDDPMFGRRGYAKEVIADPKHGFLVLVVAYRAKKCPQLGWVEPFKPRDCDRQYWPPGKVEIA